MAEGCRNGGRVLPCHGWVSETRNQLQRAAVSIPANIAEGRSRKHTREFLQHLSIAYGSLAELETHVEIARRLGYLPTEDAGAIHSSCATIGRMLNSLQRSLSCKEPH